MLTRPPYLRWLTAGALIAGALAWEVISQATEQMPVAAARIARGAVIAEDDIAWRAVPTGVGQFINPVGFAALVTIEEGDPISESTITAGITVPVGWWTVPADVPLGAVRGSAVRIVLGSGVGVTGLVVEPSTEDAFGILSAGLIAVPPNRADQVAMEASATELVVLFEP